MVQIINIYKDEIKLHRKVLRGRSHKRQRPNNLRFKDKITQNLKKRNMKYEYGQFNWIGETWKNGLNKGIAPSFSQIANGLIAECKV